jgi:preprotein translocase subunit SecD
LACVPGAGSGVRTGRKADAAITHFRRYRRHRSVSAAGIVSSGVGAWRVTEPVVEFPGEKSIVVKAAGVGDFAERLAYVLQPPAMQKPGGVVQTKRMDE